MNRNEKLMYLCLLIATITVVFMVVGCVYKKPATNEMFKNNHKNNKLKEMFMNKLKNKNEKDDKIVDFMKNNKEYFLDKSTKKELLNAIDEIMKQQKAKKK